MKQRVQCSTTCSEIHEVYGLKVSVTVSISDDGDSSKRGTDLNCTTKTWRRSSRHEGVN